MSPVDSCGTAKRLAILVACVPFPAPGGPNRNPANYPPGQIKPIKAYIDHDAYGKVPITKWIGGRLPNGEQTCFTQQLGRQGRRVESFAAEGRVYDAKKGTWK
jgi:hypothetical protein